MREKVEAWGRLRWPGARVFHELNVGECRADMAFIGEDDLILIEIISDKDVVDRKEKQIKTFREHAPEFWLALSPKWVNSTKLPYVPNRLIVSESGVEISPFYRVTQNGLCFNKMLHLIWAEEARAIAARHGCLSNKRQTLSSLLPVLAKRLTGQEILTGVCRELRGRGTAHKADAPIRMDGDPVKAGLTLFR